jgi:hypothetical protein
VRARAFRTEYEPVARREADLAERRGAVRGQREHARGVRLLGSHQRIPAFMHAHRRVLVIVEPRAPHPGVFERKSQRLDQMQLRAGVGAQADHIAGVRRDFGFDKNDVEHDGIGENRSAAYR